MKSFWPFFLILFLFPSCNKDKPSAQDNPPQTVPEADTWWNDDVFYEIFVRSFYDSNGDGIGDFNGITQKLDYLNDGDPHTDTDLGITALWLMPIYPSPSYHGYDITDYRAVNPQYGTMDDFKHLLNEAHKRGIKIIIDFVINHTSDQHPWFINSASGPGAAKRNWYIWSSNDPGYAGPWGQQVWYEKNGSYYYAIFWSGMPDLNYGNKDVTAEIEDIAQYWYKDIGIDGYRMDAAQYLVESGQNQANTDATRAWWRNFYAFQKNLDPGLMSVGEVWISTADVVPYTGKGLDYCFEFDLASALVNSVKSGNPEGLKNKLQEVVDSYPPLQYGVFLTNHDQNRVMDELGQDVRKARLAAGILLTLPGIPYIYYGEEVGMLGTKPDENIRRPMQWSGDTNGGFTSGTPWEALNTNFNEFNVNTMSADSSSLWNVYRRFIHLRAGNEALREGDYTGVESGNSYVLAYLRSTPDESLLVIHNFRLDAVKNLQFSVPESSVPAGDYNAIEIFSGKNMASLTIDSNGGFSGFAPVDSLNALTSCVLKLEKQ